MTKKHDQKIHKMTKSRPIPALISSQFLGMAWENLFTVGRNETKSWTTFFCNIIPTNVCVFVSVTVVGLLLVFAYIFGARIGAALYLFLVDIFPPDLDILYHTHKKFF